MTSKRLDEIGRILASMDSEICKSPFDEKVQDILELIYEEMKGKNGGE